MRRVAFVVPVLLLAASACDAPAVTGPEARFTEVQTISPVPETTGPAEADATQTANGGIMMGSGG